MVKLMWMYRNFIVHAAILVIAFPLAIDAEAASDECVLSQLEQHPAHEGVSLDLPYETWRIALCQFVEGDLQFQDLHQQSDWMGASLQKRSTRIEFASNVWNSQLSFGFFCTNRSREERRESATPEEIELVIAKFCGDINEALRLIAPSESGRAMGEIRAQDFFESLFPVAEHYVWFRKELFCQITEYIAYPGGWPGVLQPDVAAVDRLQSSSVSLCNEVRNDTLTVDEAGYRWSQEWLRFERRVGPEVVRKTADYLRNILERFTIK